MLEHAFSSKFCAYLLAYPKHGKTLTLAEVISAAKLVNLRHPSPENVRVREQPKADGGTRVITSFGPLDRAGQRLADDLLRIRWGFSSLEYSRKGKGRDAAIRDILEAHNEGGARRYIKADVSGFYPAIDMEKMAKSIPLPNAIVRNTLCIPPTKKVDLTYAPNTSEIAVRKGPPAGSRPSALIASRAIEQMLHNLPGERLTVNHGDDMLVAIRTDDEAETVKKTLAQRATEHPCGPFKLKELCELQIGKPHDFLGYMLRHRPKPFGGGIRLSVSRKAILRFQRRFARDVALLPVTSWDKLAEQKCRNWVMSFGQWKHNDAVIDFALSDLEWEVFPILAQFRTQIKGQSFASLAEIMSLFDEIFLPHIGKQWAKVKASVAH